MFVVDRDRPLRLILPRCRACNRYLITWLHAVIFGLLVTAAMIFLLESL